MEGCGMDFLLGASSGDIGTLALGLVIAGVVSGLIAGLLGVGCGLVIVPVLYQVLESMGVPPDARMHVAVGTSLAAIVPTALASLYSQAKKGAVEWRLLKRWLAPMLVGVIAGAVLAGMAPGEGLTLFFGGVALLLAAYLAFGKEGWRLGEHVPRGLGGAALPFGIGGVSTMMGIGGGTIGVPAMTLYGMPVQRALATASVFGAVIAIPGTTGAVLAGWHAEHLPASCFGYVYLLGFAIIAPLLCVIAPIGAHYAHLADTQRLRRLFALFVAVTAAKMLWDVMG
jgi:uncharacterized protein